MICIKCPMCDYVIKLDDNSLDCLSTCHSCGFDFLSNKCSNQECNRHLSFNKSFCSLCGYESTFYLNSCDVRINYVEDESEDL